jgi:hypothetical protein
MVSRELILELQIILKEEFGLDLTYEKTESLGNFLTSYFKTLIFINSKK